MPETAQHKSPQGIPPSVAVWFVLGALILTALAWLWWGERPGDAPPAPETVEVVRPAALDPPAPRRDLRIERIEHAADSVEFDVRLPAGAELPKAGEPLFFAVPPEGNLSADIVSYRVGDRTHVRALEDEKRTTEGLSAIRTLRKTVEVEDKGIMRRWRIAALDLRPNFFAMHNPDQKEELSARLAIRWTEPYEAAPEPPHPSELAEDWGWGSVGRLLVENVKGLELYQIDKPPLRGGVQPQITAPWHTIEGDRPWARLELKEKGLYRLAVEDLIAVGFPPEKIEPQAVRVFARGEAVPLIRRGEGDAERIYLWNDANLTPYARERTYWVTLGEDLPDPRLEPFAPAGDDLERVQRIRRTAKLDRDNEMLIEAGNFLSIKNLTWVDAPIPEQVEGRLRVPLTFHDYAPTTASLQARLKFYVDSGGQSVSTHQYNVKLTIDGATTTTIALSTSYQNPTEIEYNMTLAPDAIRNGVVEFAMTRAEAGSNVAGMPSNLSPQPKPPPPLWFDAIEVDYPARAVPVEGRLTLRAPDKKTGGALWTTLPTSASTPPELFGVLVGDQDRAVGFLEPERRHGVWGVAWRGGSHFRAELYAPDAPAPTPPFASVSESNPAVADEAVDYLIISHREFIDLVEPLAQFHRQQGRTTRIVDVQTVYDHFSHGELSPEAIRDFLAWTLHHWPESPTYVLLVGDASSDYRGEARNEVRNWLPSYTYRHRDDDWASDHWMTVVSGEDDFGEFMIGRLSVANRDDARTIVNKIIAYAREPKPGPWRARLGYVADDGEFPPAVEVVRKAYTPQAYDPARLYLDEQTSLEDNWYLDPQLVEERGLKVSPELTARLIRAFERGMSYLTYYGHGSPNIWMDERVWFGGDSPNSDNLHLIGSGYESFVANMTCNSGAIDYPVPPWNINISEDMMRVENGGAIGMFVPSGPSVTAIHQKISAQLHRALFRDGVRRLGEAIALTRTRYAAYGHPQQLTYMFILLGDPAIELQLADRPRTFTPDKRNYRPGETIELTVAGLDPPEGKYVASLDRTADAKTIWESEPATYDGGKIPFRIDLPTDVPLGDATLRFYAWKDNPGEELTASATLTIEQPDAAIRKTAWLRGMERGGMLRIELENRAGVPAEDLVLSVQKASQSTSETLFAREIELAAGAEETLEVPLPKTPKEQSEGVLLETRLVEKGTPPLALPEDRIDRAFIPPSEDWAGLVAGMSRREPISSGRLLRIHATAVGGLDAPERRIVGLDDAQGDAISTQSLTLATYRGDAREGTQIFTLRAADVDRASSGTLWLAAPDDVNAGQPAKRIGEVALDAIPLFAPRLQIVPGSIRVQPESPSEGETIFFHFKVRNVGNLPAPHYTAVLYDEEDRTGRKPLPAHIGSGRHQGRNLEPGAVEEIMLRWDPVSNAGERTVRIEVDPGTPAGEPLDPSLVETVSLYVRTKHDLRRGKTWLEAREGPGGKTEYYLLGEVFNVGETRAENVVVAFYRSHARSEENLIGEYTLPYVPPGKRVLAEVRLPVDPERDLAPGSDPPRLKYEPMHELQLKGSKQRIRRLVDEPAP